MTIKKSRKRRAAIALAAILIFAGHAAEARMGGRSSMGSRGSRTWSAPPSTNTAPSAASPIQRSQIPNAGPGINGAGPGAPAAAPSRFGLGTGLMAGLFGAGLLGMLMGNGFFGGLAGLGSVFGLLIQVGLVVLLVSFVMKWFRRRQEPIYANHGHARAVPGIAEPRTGIPGLGGLGAGLGAALGGLSNKTRSAGPRVRDEVAIGEKDLAEFERSLVEMQAAYSRSDIETIRSMATPEMAGYIQEELNDFATRGESNQVSDVKLLQGDLAESWREGDTDYASVAMRYGLIDVTTDKATGRIVQGHPTERIEATEVWTFRRNRGAPWELSAIQQT